jgi:hypothetical protein
VRGGRFYFTFTPFLACFLLALGALGLATNAVITYATEKPVVATAKAEPTQMTTSLHTVALKEAESIKQTLKEAADKLEAEKTAAESQKPIVVQASTQHAVSPTQPQGCNAARPFIYIASSGMCMSIISVGLTPEGAVGTPSSLYQAGWYNGSAALGSGGASFVDGHSPGNFSAIKSVGYGTVITIGLANGQNINYQVTGIENVPLAQVNMSKVLSSPGLNLMTCNGSPVGNTYSHRFIVYSSRI